MLAEILFSDDSRSKSLPHPFQFLEISDVLCEYIISVHLSLLYLSVCVSKVKFLPITYILKYNIYLKLRIIEQKGRAGKKRSSFPDSFPKWLQHTGKGLGGAKSSILASYRVADPHAQGTSSVVSQGHWDDTALNLPGLDPTL